MKTLKSLRSKDLRHLALASAAVSMMSACMSGPGFLKQDNAAVLSDTPSTVVVPVETSADGSMSATLSAQSGETQAVVAPEGSAVAGSSLQFPPGTLGVDTVVTMEEGASLADMDITNELGIGAVQASGASAALVISNSAKIDAAQPFTVNLSLDSGSGLHLQQANTQLVVFYKVTKAEAGAATFVGIIPNSELVISGKNISFKTRYFGAFQAVYVPVDIVVPQEKPAEKPIVTKREVDQTGGQTTTTEPVSSLPVEISAAAVTSVGTDNVRLKWRIDSAVKGFLVVYVPAGVNGVVAGQTSLTGTPPEQCKSTAAMTRSVAYRGSDSEYVLTGLSPFTPYAIRICAVTDNGPTKGVIVSARTKDLAPSNPSMSAVNEISSKSVEFLFNGPFPAHMSQIRIVWNLGSTAPSSCMVTTRLRDSFPQGRIEIGEFAAEQIVAFRICGRNRDGVLSTGLTPPPVTTKALVDICATGNLDNPTTPCVVDDLQEVSDGTIISGLGKLQIVSGGSIQPMGPGMLRIDVSQEVRIEDGGSISAAGYGHPGGSPTGNGSGPAGGEIYGGTHGGGGGYGGQGGVANEASALPSMSYGDFAQPYDMGSGGGGSDSDSGGNGGGAIEIRTLRLVNNGYISAVGHSGTGAAGGGAGGSIVIYVKDYWTDAIASGLIKAYGGDAPGGGGGGAGGRIALHYEPSVSSSLVRTEFNVDGGESTLTTFGDGAAGTIFIFDKQLKQGELHVAGAGSLHPASSARARTPIDINATYFAYNLALVKLNGASRAFFSSPIPDSVKIQRLNVTANAALDHTGLGLPGSTNDLTADIAQGGGGNAISTHTGGGGGAGAGGSGGAGSANLSGDPGGAAGSGLATSETSPLRPGGGGGAGFGSFSLAGHGGNGGGVLRLKIDGELILNGAIRADGEPGHLGGSVCGGGGGGGSVWITASTVQANGSVSASGGSADDTCSYYGGGGGGGRIFIDAGAMAGSLICYVSGGLGANAGAGGVAKYRVGGGSITTCSPPR